MNPFLPFVTSFSRLAAEGRSLSLSLGNDVPARGPEPGAEAPLALIFSPHPDDECIVGGLALRLRREGGMSVTNVAVTLGSDPARQKPRLEELLRACDWLGFRLEQIGDSGLEKINAKTRATEAERWVGAVKTIAELLVRRRPRVVFLPHAADWNSTHVGTHLLVMDALAATPPEFETTLVETEFWGQMASPNLMVEIKAEDLADLVAALSLHTGEVSRNPYHLRLPAWMQDNVRRGSELVGGQGGAAPEMDFSTLYRVLRWAKGQASVAYAGGKQIMAGDSPLAAITF